MRRAFLVFLFRVAMKPTPVNKKTVEEQEKTLENRDLITGHGFDFFRLLEYKMKLLDSRLCMSRETEGCGIYRMSS